VFASGSHVHSFSFVLHHRTRLPSILLNLQPHSESLLWIEALTETAGVACPDPKLQCTPAGPSSVSLVLAQPKTTRLKIPTRVYLAPRSYHCGGSPASCRRCVKQDDGQHSFPLFWREHRSDPPLEIPVGEVDSQITFSPYRHGAFC